MSTKDVFISYKTSERNEAQWVKDALESSGLSCWIAPDCIPGGSDYATQIPKAIRECKVFVLVLSEGAQSSKWVPKEVDQAINDDKVILPFMLEDCPLKDNFQFYLSNCQRYNAFENRNTAMSKMLADIKSIIAKSSGEQKKEPVRPEPTATHKNPEPFKGAEPKTNQPAGSYDVYLTVAVTAKEAAMGCSKMVVINGNGAVGKKLEVKIPAGIKGGTKLRLSGQGKFNPTTGKNGDIYLVVNVVGNTNTAPNTKAAPPATKTTGAPSNLNWGAMSDTQLYKYASKNSVPGIILFAFGCFCAILCLALIADNASYEGVVMFLFNAVIFLTIGWQLIKKNKANKNAAMEELARRRR